MNKKIRIGTRASPLAMAQAREVETYLLAAHPQLIGHTELVPMTTLGDKITDRDLIEVGGKALFTKEIEDALLKDEVDIAVHSMKDVPTFNPPGLVIPCILPREDPRDAVIISGGRTLQELPEEFIIGTSSLRRRAQMLVKYPKAKVVSLRGNVGTRLKKLEAGEADVTLLAAAGLIRLGLGEIASHVFEIDNFIPCVGQGALGVQCRMDDERMLHFLEDLNDPDTADCIAAERSFMTQLDGSCRTPLGAYAEVHGQVMTLRGFMSDADGSDFRKVFLEGIRSEAVHLGIRAAKRVAGGT